MKVGLCIDAIGKRVKVTKGCRLHFPNCMIGKKIELELELDSGRLEELGLSDRKKREIERAMGKNVLTMKRLVLCGGKEGNLIGYLSMKKCFVGCYFVIVNIL